jgi:autotransporter family porin
LEVNRLQIVSTAVEFQATAAAQSMGSIVPSHEPEPEVPETAPPPPPSQIPPVPVPTEGDPTTEPVDPTPPVQASNPAPQAPPAPQPAAEPTPPPPVEEFALLQDPSAALPRPNPDRSENGVIPLYRGEVPTFGVIPGTARYLAVSTLGTFHERRGEQALLEGASFLPAAWGRVFGQDIEMSWTGTLTPTFDGTLFGLQAGLDLFGWEYGNDQHDRVGVFLSHTRMNGDVGSPTLGGFDAVFGDLDVNGTSIGATWTHVGPQGWYLDGVVMGTWFGGDATSGAGENVDVDGSGVTLSLEGGYPFQITPEWTLEPQAQLIWQHLSLDDTADSFSTVSFDSDDGVTGRIGLRLQGNFQTEAAINFQPYLKANLWHNFDGEDRIIFGETPIITEIGDCTRARRRRGGEAVGIDQPVRHRRLHFRCRRRENADLRGQYRAEREVVSGWLKRPPPA